MIKNMFILTQLGKKDSCNFISVAINEKFQDRNADKMEIIFQETFLCAKIRQKRDDFYEKLP